MTGDTCCGCNSKVECVDQQDDHAGKPDVHATDGFVSEFTVPKMDCPAEEGMIRMALENLSQPLALEFDIPARKVRVFHNDTVDEIRSVMEGLGLGASLQSTQAISNEAFADAHAAASEMEDKDARVLRLLLVINAVMFGVELVVGWLAQSTGLIADSLDMLADAAVYGLALYAVGHSAHKKLRAAHISGWLQMLLATGVLIEVGRRFWFGSEPVSSLMMSIGLLALAANVICLLLIARNKDNGLICRLAGYFQLMM